MASKKFKQGCEASIKRDPKSKFSKSCAKRYPELVGGKPRPKLKPTPVPEACRKVLSVEMKKGNRKGALTKFWECRRAAEKDA